MFEEIDGVSKERGNRLKNQDSICFLSTSACLLPQRGDEEIYTDRHPYIRGEFLSSQPHGNYDFYVWTLLMF